HVPVTCIVDQMIEAVALPGLCQQGPEAFHEIGEGGNGARIKLQGDSLASKCLDFGDDLGRLLLAGAIGDDDVATLAGDGEGGVAAEAAAGTGDECDLG